MILSFALILAFAVAPALLGLRMGSLLVSLSSVVLVILFAVGVEVAFVRGVILPVPEPIVSLGVATGGVIVVENVIERRKRRALETLLQDFLRPAADIAFFLSYRRDQSSFIARSLRSALAARFGDGSVFLDEAAIAPGREWPREIQEAILGCSALLVIMGPHWLAAQDAASGARRLDNRDDWVRREVEEGLGRPEIAVHPGSHRRGDQCRTAMICRSPSGRCATARPSSSPVPTWTRRWEDKLVGGIRRGQLRPLRRAGIRSSPPAGDVPIARHADGQES